MELKFNAYNVLGLESSASHKEINKRYKEMEKYLNIGEVPSYENDIDFFSYKEIRTSGSIKDAFELLSHSKTKILEFFFWFQINDEKDEEAMVFIKEKKYEEALKIWKDLYETDRTSKRFFYAKNFLILFLIQGGMGNESKIKLSILVWKEVIDSQSFWNSFAVYFEGVSDDDGDGIKMSEITKNEITKNLSSLYMGLGESIRDLSIFGEFSKVFNLSTSSMEHNILDRIYEDVQKAVESLEGLDISTDGVFDNEEKKIVKESVGYIQDALNKTIDLGFYEDSKILLYRDRASSAIRKIALDLHNNLDERNRSLGLFKIALNICGTGNLKESLGEDIKTIEGNIDYTKNEKCIDDIISDFKNGKADIALKTIDQKLTESGASEELKKILLDLKVAHYDRIQKHGQPVKSAPSLFTLNGVGVKIYGDTRYFVFIFIPIFPIDRWSLTDLGGQYEFYGKLELTSIQTIWRNMAILGIVIWIIIAMNSK